MLMEMHVHLDQFEREALVEDTVDSGSTWELVRVDLITGTFDTFFEVHWKLLDHPVSKKSASDTSKHKVRQSNSRIQICFPRICREISGNKRQTSDRLKNKKNKSSQMCSVCALWKIWLTVEGPWFFGTGHRDGSACTLRLPSLWISAGSAACS